MFIPVDTLDVVEKLVHIFGVPGIIGVIVWLIRTYDKGRADIGKIVRTTSDSQRMTMEVHGMVETIRTNHLAHLAEDMKALAEDYRDGNKILGSIDKGIAVLVERGK